MGFRERETRTRTIQKIPDAQGVNKAAAIRRIFRRNPNLTAKEVADLLADEGILVNDADVNNVKREFKGYCAKDSMILVRRLSHLIDEYTYEQWSIAVETVRDLVGHGIRIGEARNGSEAKAEIMDPPTPTEATPSAN